MKSIRKQSIPRLNPLFHHVVRTIIPRPVWNVGTGSEDGTHNLSTITCISNTPGPPETIIASMAAKRTIANIQRTGELSVALCNAGMSEVGGFHTFFGEVLTLHIDTELCNPLTDSNEAILKWLKQINIHKTDPMIYHSVQKFYRVGKKTE
jgi:flavin reductase (DIM6/NTAB) family NADH-FMN oxidoreductase RutF